MDKFERFANEYGQYAVNASKRFGLLPEFILAVAAHETGFGASYSSQIDKNFFGLSASSFYSKEFWNGVSKRKTSDSAGYYRQYDSVQNSFYDFGWLMNNAARYKAVMNGSNNLEATVTAFINSGYFTANRTAYANALLDYAPKLKQYIKSPFPWGLVLGSIGFLIIIKNKNGN